MGFFNITRPSSAAKYQGTWLEDFYKGDKQAEAAPQAWKDLNPGETKLAPGEWGYENQQQQEAATAGAEDRKAPAKPNYNPLMFRNAWGNTGAGMSAISGFGGMGSRTPGAFKASQGFGGFGFGGGASRDLF